MNPIALADLHWDCKKLIGEGCFGGQVYKTTWSHTNENGDSVEDTVAVVDLKDASGDQILDERDRRSSLSYKRVVQLLGWCQREVSVDLQHPMLVFEHSKDGDLWNYLNRDAGDELTSDVMKKMACDIARGMRYLHWKNIVHGDLAARNCIVYRPRSDDDLWEVKVGDNGYYNINFKGCYYNQPQDPVRCPVRWMAPENLPFRLDDGKMIPSGHAKSRKGDMWAFGVVLFEIWTKGKFPFDGLTDYEVCRRVLSGSKATHGAHDKLNEIMGNIWQMMFNCWQRNPAQRPSFKSIRKSFEKRGGCEFSSESEQSSSDDDDDYYYDSDYDYYNDYYYDSD